MENKGKLILIDIDSTLGEVGKIVASKLNCILEKNVGSNTLSRILKVLSGDLFGTSDIKQELCGGLGYFKYTLIASEDVENLATLPNYPGKQLAVICTFDEVRISNFVLVFYFYKCYKYAY